VGAARAACVAEIAQLEAEPGLPGDPELEAHRAETFARAKADAVIFVRPPAARALTPEGERMRRSVLSAQDPVKALYGVYPTLQKRRDLARETLLTEGYLFAAWPPFAAALSNLVRPEDLFREPELWIQRGEEVLRSVLRKDAGGASYVVADGPESGTRVKLLLYDRVVTAPGELTDPLHRDAGAVSRVMGFEEMRVRHLAVHALVADLLYGGVWVPTVLSSHGATLTLGCEAIPVGSEATVARARSETLRRRAALDRLRAIMREQVAEGLPFDEPRTEVGQQDGQLRQHWVWAYRYGRTEYEFNQDRYRVFDEGGRPRVPQVCIDFVTDTLERAGGSWYGSRGQPRERSRGRLDFAALGIDNERSVERFVEFAKAHPQSFEVVEVPSEERVPYAHRAEFFLDLAAHRERYRPGDVVTIYGFRSDGKRHYHSFFVYDADPVTGAPSLVAANAGRPRIRPWESEMQSAPLRSIHARIRPQLEWLESVIDEPPPAPPPGPTDPGGRKPEPTTI
jgi:hypothetical protein